MHARVMTVQLKQGTAEDATRVYRESVLPAARRQPGFQRAFFLVDPETHRAISITHWVSQELMETSESSGYLQEQVAKLAIFFASPMSSEHYEVAVSAKASSKPYPSLPLPNA